jgi:hypothetical protein
MQRTDGAWVLAFARDRLGDSHCYVMTSGDGSTWNDPVRIPGAAYTDSSPTLFEQNGVLHIVYTSNRTGSWKGYESTSVDGRTWSPATLLEITAEAPLDLSIAVSKNQQSLAFETLKGGVSSSRRTSSGGTWSKPVQVESLSGAPSLALDASNLGQMWVRQGDRSVLYSETRTDSWMSRNLTISGQAAWVRGLEGAWIVATPDGFIEQHLKDGPGFQSSQRFQSGTVPATDPCAVQSAQGKLWVTFSDETTGRIRLARQRV